MSILSLFLPVMLMVHNMVDFRNNGACESYATYLDYAVTEFVEMVEEHNSLKLINKTGTFDDKIHRVGLIFEVEGSYQVDAARNMIVGLIDSLVSALNTGCCGRLQPFLCPCPFTPDQVEIELHFVENCLYSYPLPYSVQVAIYADGRINYFMQKRGCIPRLAKLHGETLEFARYLALPPDFISCPRIKIPCARLPIPH